MTEFLERYQRAINHLVPRLAVWLVMLASVSSLAVGQPVVGSVLLLITVGAIALGRLRTDDADRHLVARAALTAAAGLSLAFSSAQSWVAVAATVLLLGTLAGESTVEHVIRPSLRAWNLPGHPTSPQGRTFEPMLAANSAGLSAIALGLLGLPIPAVAAAVLVFLAAGLAAAGLRLIQVRQHRPERRIREALTSYAPAYYLYFSGTPQASYQLTMWLPYLARTGGRGALVIRDPQFVRTAVELTGLPVILARSVESLEYAFVPSAKACFYVNNDHRNVHGVRFTRLTHVHLGHGDSDKPASYSATFAMFDKVFVSGQAAVDRFAEHGVQIPAEKFVLVGRPQVEAIEVADPDRPAAAQPVVLYAPTWRGGLEDSLFGSLQHGERIVSALLAAGATVWFRPHPYSWRDAASRVHIAQIDALLAADTSRPHSPSRETSAHTVFDCMNASDAMVTDISSVASDYLYSNKPFAITDPGSLGDLEDNYPLARAAILLRLDGDLSDAVTDLLTIDSRRAERAELRRYYLGDWPAAEYSEAFVAAARAAIQGPPTTRS